MLIILINDTNAAWIQTSLQDVNTFLRGNFFSRILGEMKDWTQKNTVYEAFSDSYYKLINHDSFSIQLFTYWQNNNIVHMFNNNNIIPQQNRSTNGRAREIHETVNTGLNPEVSALLLLKSTSTELDPLRVRNNIVKYSQIVQFCTWTHEH